MPYQLFLCTHVFEIKLGLYSNTLAVYSNTLSLFSLKCISMISQASNYPPIATHLTTIWEELKVTEMYKVQPTKYLCTHHVQWTTVNILLYLPSVIFPKENVCNQILPTRLLTYFSPCKGLLKSIRLNYGVECPHLSQGKASEQWSC